jgi:hypothetical protein
VVTEPARTKDSAAAPCACCGKKVYRMHGLVVLLRVPKQAVSMRVACVGYCADHREEAVDAGLEEMRGRGQIVMVASPELVRPNRQLSWRRSTTARLATAAQLLLSSADAVGEPLPYPVEPVATESVPPKARPRRPVASPDAHEQAHG